MELIDSIEVSNTSTREPSSTSSHEDEKSRMHISLVCKFEKSLYGLKLVLRCWNKRFKRFLQKFNFIECFADGCMFYCKV